MSFNLARFPLIGIETNSPTSDHYRCEAAMWRAKASRIEGEKYGAASKAYLHAVAMAERHERIAKVLYGSAEARAAA